MRICWKSFLASRDIPSFAVDLAFSSRQGTLLALTEASGVCLAQCNVSLVQLVVSAEGDVQQILAASTAICRIIGSRSCPRSRRDVY